MDKTTAPSARAALTAGAKPAPHRGRPAEKPAASAREQKRFEAEQRQARSRERKAQQQIVHQLEKEIHSLESRQPELTAELEKAETYQQPGRPLEINRELTGLLDDLKSLNKDWEAAALRLEKL